MALPTLNADLTGNTVLEDAAKITWDSMLNVKIASALQPYICSGTGAPTFAAPKGSMYTRLDGGAGTVLYVNSTGTSTWQVVTSA